VSDPIDVLLGEHRDILAEFARLRTAVADLAARGEAALPAARPVLAGVGTMMATRLLLHARKEDEALFPALEAVFGAEGTPTAAMREEHRAIHAEAERFRATLRELNDVEHPALVSEGAALRGLVAGRAGAEPLRRTGERILDLVDTHFGKEEQVLFPMARAILSDEAMRGVMRRMEDIAGGG
jgi:hemerythrin-like domain-containing protein